MGDIKGNIESIRQTTLDEIKAIYDMPNESGDMLPPDMVSKLAALTEKINREIAVYIDRKGKVQDISIGDSTTAPLPEIKSRRSEAKLSGIRCVHTHPGGSGMLSKVDVASLINLRLDAMFAIGVTEGKPTDIFVGIPAPDSEGSLEKAQIYGPFSPSDRKLNQVAMLVNEVEKDMTNTLYSNEERNEKAILVAVDQGGRVIDGKSEGERLLDELEELAATAGATVMGKVLQKKEAPDTTFYIGKGKLEEIILMAQAEDVDMLIFDDELSPSQIRNIEKMTGLTVIDRTALILDIFAQRARSMEGKLQVELAQLNYRLPRLMGLGNQLSRLGGGIGTRGPGEKKLEMDKRHIRRRIQQLEEELKKVSQRRNFSRDTRKEFSTVAIVGYTNAGKSTLLNKLCNSDVMAENMLFATLDPTTRGLDLPDSRKILVTDTVGFIRKLPHDLIEAFKSSLEEAVEADLLIHVVDSTSSEKEEHIKVVNELLKNLGALNKPVLLVLNKIDALENSELERIKYPYGKVFEISAAKGTGLDELLEGIIEELPQSEREMHLQVPYSAGWVVPYIHENGRILEENYDENGLNIRAVVKMRYISRLEEFEKRGN
jgi:GTP-binding protein HflX